MHPRIKREKRIVESMITNYCLAIHNSTELCTECHELMEYVDKRLLKCPFIKNKPVCTNCEIHCYNKKQQEQIKLVMRTVGPKMLFTNTLDTIWYFYYKFVHKYQNVKQ